MDAIFHSPTILPRSEHCISRANISPNALKVLYRLRKAGYRACLVGGGVRDLLLGREPKDFDVATDASPAQVRELFRNCRLIGRRFRLAHVHFGREIIEVATFRGTHDNDALDDDAADVRYEEGGRILRDNVFGTIEEDAVRRDFTVNALYYDIENFSILDYVRGVEDLDEGVIRLIGDPVRRYREDPVRMLRAVRFAAKLGLRIHSESAAPLSELGHLLGGLPPARLFDEVLKLFLGGQAVQTFEMLRHYGLFAYLFPATERALSREENGFPHMLLVRALENTDARIQEDKPVTPAFLFAALLWHPMQEHAHAMLKTGDLSDFEAMKLASDEVLAEQVRRTYIPRRFTNALREIWFLQQRLLQRAGKRPLRVLEHVRFRAAYDFLLLRNQAGEALEEECRWWTEFQEVDDEGRQRMLVPARRNRRGRGIPRRRGRRNPAEATRQ